MLPAPRRVQLSHNGEAAKRQWKPRSKEQTPYEGPVKRRKSCHSKPQFIQRIYDLRESADDDEIKTAITVHGELKHKLETRRLLDRRYAILVFEDLLESIAAKREMEHKWWNWVVRMEVNGGFKEDVAAAGLKVDFINRKTAVELIKGDDEARKKASAPPAYTLMDEQSVDALSVDEEGEFFAHGLLRPDDLLPMSDDEFDAGWADNLCQPSMQRFATLDDDSFDEDLANSLCEELALDAAADYACSLQCK